MSLFYKILLLALNIISTVLYHSGPTFWQFLYSCQDLFVVDTSDYSGHLIRHLLNALEAFPTEWFLQFWEHSKSGGLISGLYGGWGSTCHPYFSKISDTAPEAWGLALSCKMRTPAVNMVNILSNFWTANILQKHSVACRWKPEALCCYHSIVVISHNHHELNFRLLAATFLLARRSCMLPLRGLRFHLWFKISYPCFIYGKNSLQKLFTFCLVAPQQFFCDPLASCFLCSLSWCANHIQRLFSSAMFESRFWKLKLLTCLFMRSVDLLPTECWW